LPSLNQSLQGSSPSSSPKNMARVRFKYWYNVGLEYEIKVYKACSYCPVNYVLRCL